jgi:hypothetical protein
MKYGVVILAIIMPLIAPASASDMDHPVVVNPAEAPELVRREILSHTPRGSTIDEVRKFIREQLHVEEQPLPGDTPAFSAANGDSGQLEVRNIQVLLERYITNPLLLTLQIPLPLATDVLVQWTFDRDGKLLDVSVEKVLEGS